MTAIVLLLVLFAFGVGICMGFLMGKQAMFNKIANTPRQSIRDLL